MLGMASFDPRGRLVGLGKPYRCARQEKKLLARLCTQGGFEAVLALPSPRPCPQPFLRPGLDLVASGIPGGPAVMPLPCTRTKHRIFGPGLSLSFCHSVMVSGFPKIEQNSHRNGP